jgi:hypothetical protein
MMSMESIVQGRWIGPEEVELIRGFLAENPGWNRTRLSRELCTIWDWRNERGNVKDMAARTLLLKLERNGLITLPRRNNGSPNATRNSVLPEPLPDRMPITGALSDLQPITVRLVDNAGDRLLFRRLVARYHYLGLRNTVGENLKYLAKDVQGRPVGALLFGSAAWKTQSRDAFIGWDARLREAGLSRITNNTRFLIPEWVRVPHLASHVLSRVARRIGDDWQAKYGHRVYLLETFVDRSRFRGTCYQAANWIRVGHTQGRTRNDRYSTIQVPVKAVYVYPLTPNFRRELGIPALARAGVGTGR